jgi:multidrug resistance efflux pump
MQIAQAQARQALAQRRLSESQAGRARVEAPFDGIIVSGDLSQSLGSAVKKGQSLFEIAPLSSYRIVMEVEEADIGQVREGQKGELMVTALAGQPFPFTVTLVTPVARANEGRNHFRVEASLDGNATRLRPGMEGIARIAIDERKRVWIWTHRMTDWARLQIWNWLGV